MIPDKIKQLVTYKSSTAQEELVNALTHGLGVLLILIASPYLISKATSYAQTPMVVAAGIFSFSMLACYLSSTLYHSLQRNSFLIADHISIFLLIGGTYTPLVIKFAPPSVAIPFLTVLW